MAPGKRKRGDRADSTDKNSRPSPHRPQQLPSAHPQQQQNNAGAGRRTSKSLGRGALGIPDSPSASQSSPTAMSPPVTVPSSSKPQLAAPTPTASSVSTTQPPTSLDPSTVPFSNKYLTEDRATAWSGTGRDAVVDAGAKAQAAGDMITLSFIFEELVQASINQSLAPEQVGSAIRDILATPSSSAIDSASILLDTVSTITEHLPHPPTLRSMLEAAAVDPTRMRGELENNLLSTLNLVRPSFARVGIRKATHALYRQSNYNLLREEAEGYSKLVTEYFTTVEIKPPNEEVVTATFQRVKALIGAFDLDVGRVLDVTLDVFANLLVKHKDFFIKFLRVSSWWPEQKVPHGIEWEEPLISALPRWAHPGSFNWFYTDEEKTEQLHLREVRDQAFWASVDELGIKAFFQLGARRITSSTIPLEKINIHEMEGVEASDKKGAEASEFEKIQAWSQEWMAETQSLPPSGNRIAAQLLGFKLRFYASDARDAHDTLPDNLIYLSALLIKIGFISLADLYPHLYPLDEDMPTHREKLLKAKKERAEKLRGKSTNALAMAGALSDDTLPPAPISRLRNSETKTPSKPESEKGTPPSAEEEQKEKLPEPVDQKVALLRSLLCIGAIPEALFILGRFPWLLDAYPDLHTYVFRLAHHSLGKVYDSIKTTAPMPMAPKEGQEGSPNVTRPSDFPGRKTLRWAKLEEKDAGDGIDYRFYWDDWADNVPICQNVDDVFRLCDSLLGFVGLRCGEDVVLLTKLARIGKHSLAEDPSKANFRRWILLSSTLLGPALSFTGRNPAVVNEVWDLFKHFDTATRYNIYTSWFVKPAGRKPALLEKFAEIKSETKGIFSKISTTNTTPMGRALAKLSYACPGIVFTMALKQAESYDNMIEPLIECCHYLTLLGYDCLNWAFIAALQEDRNAEQGDGMLTKHWLKHMAVFVGKAYRRYPLMDPTPILQFLTDQTLRGNLFMLEILEQLITSMGGIGSSLSLTESQVQGLSAGPLLRAHTMEHYLGDKRHQMKTHGKRLLKYIKGAGLAPQILVALAVELERLLYREELEDVPLKVIGARFDKLYSNFAQFLDFLRTNLTVHEFDAMIPNVVELMAEYGITQGPAFAIFRESLTEKVNAARLERKLLREKSKAETVTPKSEASTPISNQVNGDVTMGGTDTQSTVNGSSKAPDTAAPEVKASTESADVDMKDIPNAAKSSTTKTSVDAIVTTPGHKNAAVEAVAEQLRVAMPSDYGDHICLSFFITFWQLSLSDIFTVTSMKEMREYNNASRLFQEKANNVPYDRRDLSTKAVELRRAEIRGYNEQSAAFRNEAADTLGAALRTQKYLQEEMHHWFNGIPMVDARSEELHDIILQDCFLPRLVISSQDAHFSSAMLKFMHETGVPGFRTMKFLDLLFRQRLLSNVIYMCTSRESQNLGRFLNDVLKDLANWHSSQGIYTKFSQGSKKTLPGFGRTFNADRSPATFLDYEDFRRVMFKWHTQLFRALETCLKSDNYMHIRNSINIMKAIAPNFPKIDFMGKSLYQTIQNMSQTDPRDDLKLAALSLQGDFKRSERLWISPQAFHHNRNATNAQSGPSSINATTLGQSKTPQPQDAANTKLNAAAQDFNPSITNNNGTLKSPVTMGDAQEDGEVGDEKTPTATTSTENAKDPQISKHTAAPAETKMETPSQRRNVEPKSRGMQQDAKSTPGSVQSPAPPQGRPESRGTPSHSTPGSRVPHALPNRPPEGQLARARLSERANDRQGEYNAHGRNDTRSNAPSEYGRVDRAPEAFPERRDQPPGRRGRSRSPDRVLNPNDRRDPAWGARERDYHEDRSMRPPAREARGPPPAYHPREPRDPRDLRDVRDTRDPRDPRERDPRGPLPPPSVDGRGRMHPHPSAAPEEMGSYRREFPPKSHQSGDRAGNLPPRPHERTNANPNSHPLDRSTPVGERQNMASDRAGYANEDRGRNDGFRNDRDLRRDRGSRPQSPRRGEDRAPAAFPIRNEASRHLPDDRVNDRAVVDRTPPHRFPSHRERQEEPAGAAPTGPRGARHETQSSGRISRETFMQPAHAPRSSGQQVQDPNYGRLNPPSDAIPSGPRSTDPLISARHSRTKFTDHPSDVNQDRRDATRREAIPVAEQSYSPAQPAPPAAPVAAQQDQVGVHPSRLSQIQAPRLQTDLSSAPSGPRNATRTQAPAASPSSRGPPTGPAAGDRNPRNNDRNHLRTINNVLSQNVTSAPDTAGDWNSNTAPPIRGRGGARNSNFGENATMSSPATSFSHPNTPNTQRPDVQQVRGDRPEQVLNREDGRGDTRAHREGRRSDRTRHRSRSPDRSERKPDERSTRNGPEERVSRNEDSEKGGDRERGSGREKRGGDRESSRRERDRDGDRTSREGRHTRDRGPREDGRGSGRGVPPITGEAPTWPSDNRMEPRVGDGRGRPTNERREERGDRRRDDQRDRADGRKRTRGNEEPPQHIDPKRPRRSNG